jgi:hypothetical protein
MRTIPIQTSLLVALLVAMAISIPQTSQAEDAPGGIMNVKQMQGAIPQEDPPSEAGAPGHKALDPEQLDTVKGGSICFDGGVAGVPACPPGVGLGLIVTTSPPGLD